MSACKGACTCGCCSGIREETPATIRNRAGLSAIAYRIGVHATFKRSMLAALSTVGERHLTTRDDDDFSIALLDAWAVTSDVLTFYQERIANESYLRTASERLSVLELARLIGYEPAPAIAAQAWLAFNLEKGASERVVIDAGTRVQSVPGQDEEPQTFETSAPLTARLEWNEVPARTTAPRLPQAGDTSAYLSGTETALRRGDAVVFLSAANEGELRRLIDVDADFDAKRTRITWSGALVRTASKVFAMRVVTGLFGHNAPQKGLLQSPINEALDWDFVNVAPVFLDGAHPAIRPDTWLALQVSGAPTFHKVTAAAEISLSRYAVSGNATEVTLTPPIIFPADTHYRRTRVFAGSEELVLAESPVTGATEQEAIILDRVIAQPEAGRAVIVSDADGAELTFVAESPGPTSPTTLHFDPPLSRGYDPASTRVHLNVVAATHGESLRQVLGNGDATKAFQRFELSRAPLTYVADASATRGAKSTLSVQVNDVTWKETETLFGASPRERVYDTRRDAEEKTTVLFGDGKSMGPRLPSGSNNVRATYRVGAGVDGNVRANQLTTLLTRPLGVKDVVNPIAAEGGADAEVLGDARRNAPRTILTIDRVVSLRDYESFSAAFAGIGKALATWAWSGTQREVVVTIAGANGETFTASSATRKALLGALRNAGDPFVPLRIASYRKVTFRVVARVQVEPDHDPAIVLAAVRGALDSSFSFAARGFGQAVALSGVIAVIQNVAGVVFVDVDFLHRTTFPQSLAPRLAPRPPESGLGAELITIGSHVITAVEGAS